MRIGEWVQLYKHWLPIPQRMIMAFGLQERSQLYLARVVEGASSTRFGCEIIVSPVPSEAWPSVCRLSVRLNDVPRALAVATRFLREKRINILLTESCSTYQGRAHWDAICDLAEAFDFAEVRKEQRTKYEKRMGKFLDTLSDAFDDFVDLPSNRFAFVRGDAQLLKFSPLTGLNDASFICERSNVVPITHEGGAIAIPPALVDSVSSECNLPSGTLPFYALVTGNTEQRYLRVLFMRDDDQMFQVSMTNRLADFEGGGVGVLNQILEALPEEVNLIRVANYIVEKSDLVEAGRIEMIGHWRLPDVVGVAAKRAHMERTLRDKLTDLAVVDGKGISHKAALRDFEFDSPRAVYPPVFVSYSTKYDVDKFNYLLGALSASQFEPVLGTDPGATLARESARSSEVVSANVTDAAFRLIPECLAFISLQVRRDDYRVLIAEKERYVLPPWAIAEETFAWSRGVPLLLRLKDASIDNTTFDRNILTKEFSSDTEYARAVAEIVDELTKFRRGRQFAQIWAKMRDKAFRERYGTVATPRKQKRNVKAG